MISIFTPNSIISQTLEIHSLYIISTTASLKGAAILFFITFTVVSFQTTSFLSPAPVSIFAFLLISIL